MHFIFLLWLFVGGGQSALDNQDLGRMARTFCYLVRKNPIANQYNLASYCLLRVGVFDEKVCVRDPADSDAYLPETCLPLSKVMRTAKRYCPRTTTVVTTPPSTSAPIDDLLFEDTVDEDTVGNEDRIRNEESEDTTTESAFFRE